MIRIRKRNGTLQRFDVKKIRRALVMAFSENVGFVPNLNSVINTIIDKLLVSEGVFSVDHIQDTLEHVLMESGYPQVARAFILYRADRDRVRSARLKPDNKALADYIHAAKYARYQLSIGRRETYAETVERVMQMHLNKFPKLINEIQKAFEFVFDYKVLPSMRSMQFGGSAVEQHNARLYNCSYTLIDRPEVFGHIFYLLLCGCGVGYSVQWCHIDKLPAIKRINQHKVEHHIIQDSISGWADAVHRLIDSHMEGYWVEFSYELIRAEGTALRTSGGKAPGHIPLRNCLETIRRLLTSAGGRKLRPIECHDLICHIADAVLAGGIRRSSLISLFSPSDTEMLYSKAHGSFRPAYDKDPGLNAQRQMANNSAALQRGSTDRDTFDRIIRVAQENYGDPGFVFTEHKDYGTNPCGEIGLHPRIKISGSHETGFAFCNLCEINGGVIQTPTEFYAACGAASFIGTLQATYSSFPYLGIVTEAIANRDRLLGVGIMGIMNNPDLFFEDQVLNTGANICVIQNQTVAKMLGIKSAARVTTIKPGGTAPLEASAFVPVASGIHPHHARRFFRRVTANPNEPPAIEFQRVNPHMVETKPNGDWSIVFPQQVSDEAVTVKEQTAKDFLRAVFHVYENWVAPGTGVRNHEISPGLTHNVSATCTVRDGELEEILEIVWENKNRLSALSFAPYTLDTLFPYAPRQEVASAEDEAKWNNIIQNYVPVNWGDFKEQTDNTNLTGEVACAGGVCEL